MFGRILAASAVAGALVLGTAGAASAAGTAAAPPAPQWIAVSYFGTQTHCTQAATTAQQLGWLTAGQWMCDSGWLMVRLPPAA